MSGRCANCTLRCDGYLCRHCEEHVQCVNCRRYLPIYCYSDVSKQCHACVKKLAHTRSSARNIVNEVNIPTARGTESFDSFVASNSGVINAFVEDYRRQYGSIRIHVRADAIFTREMESGIQRIPAYFSSAIQDIDSTQQIDLQRVAADLSAQADHWNSRGSGFVLESIVKFVLCITQYRPLHGSTYIPTPQWLAKKHCVVNVKNSDSKCFLWSVLSAIHPPAHNPDRLSNYEPYENSLDISGLTFPLAVKDVPKFERQNPSISVNVLCCLLYTSPSPRD